MSLTDHPISQPILDISLIWTPVIAAEVEKKNYYSSVQCRLSWKFSAFFLCWYHTENLSLQ
jgi:hypothetical protein